MGADHRLRRDRFSQPRGRPLAPCQEGAGTGNIPLAAIIAQDTIMADANQTGGQNVQAKAPDELASAQGQILLKNP